MLTVHVTTSVGWIGLDGALVALDVSGLSTANPALREGSATATGLIACWVLIPVVLCALLSGLVLALSTPWGLFRHWWVLAKCVIAAALAITGVMFLLPHLPQVLAGAGEPPQVPTLIARSIAVILLLAATGFSVVKPWGKTPRGRMHATVKRARSIEPVRQES